MIITTLKPIEEITKALRGVRRIFLLGCGDCATICNTGSEEVLLEKQKEFEGEGFVVSGAAVADVGCNAASVRICFARQRQRLKNAEALVVFSCGLGIQQAGLSVSGREPKKIVAACDTRYAGVVTAPDQAEQLCSLCGECNLSETGALCVKTLCPKEMSNGPCGGVSNGKCEVFPDCECVWVTLSTRMGAQARAMFEQITLPRNFSRRNHPQKTALKK